jgi:YVTN family beta-propeller protein
MLLTIALPSYAQRVAATLNLGNTTTPLAVAVNPLTNKIYVANNGNGTVSVIDGSNNSVTVVPVGTGPRAIAVNPVTNKIYIANGGSANVTVINGADNSTAPPVSVGTTPAAIAVNPVTNKIYVANLGSTNVTVINGADNTTAPPVTVGASPRNIAVNPVTNKIYVTSQSTNSVTVIDGSNNSPTSVNIGANSFAVAVNPVSNKIYFTNQVSGNVTVMDGSNNNITPVAVGTTPLAVAVNPVTNMTYVANNGGSGSVTVIDGSNNPTTVPTGSTNAIAVAVNTVANKIYVANSTGNRLTVIDGSNNTTLLLNTGANPLAVAVNPVTNKTYVVNNGNNSVTVIDGAIDVTNTVNADSSPVAVAVNPASNKIYVANYAGNDVTVIDGSTSAAMNVADPNGPISVAVNPITNKIYVANQNSTVTVIDGVSNTTTSFSVSAPGNVLVNPVTNRIYVVSDFGAVTVIDGTSNSIVATANGGNEPVASDLNPITNKVYVADCPCDVFPPSSSVVTVIDGASNTSTSVPVGLPRAIAVNPVTNKIYVVNQNNMSVIDGFTNFVTTAFVGPNPGPIAVNPISNRIYVGNGGGGGSTVSVVDGATNFFIPVSVTAAPQAIAVNPVTNKIYVVNSDNTVAVIDGTTNSVSTLSTDIGPLAAAVNAVTNKIYVANNNSNDVTVITEQQTSAIPLTTAITALPGNQTALTQPTFTFTTSSSYAPTAPPVQAVYYQLDTWQGPWLQAPGSAPTFTTQTPVLRLGTHVLYAYAADGQSADSIQTGPQSSPNIGQITAYVFMVVPSASYAAVALSSNGNPSVLNQAVTFTATVSGGGNTPTGTVSFYDGANLLGTGALSGGLTTFTTSALTGGTHVITAVYGGDGTYEPSLSNAVYQIVRRDPTTTVVTLTAGTNPSALGASLTFTATVTSGFPGLPSGNVQFRDGNAVLATVPPAGPGTWTYTTAALALGPHAITALYLGDINFNQSLSPVFTQVVESAAAGGSTITLTVNGGAGPVTLNFGVAKATLPPQRASFVVNVTGSSNGDAVVLLEGNRQVGPILMLNAGTANYATQFPVGQHSIEAVYVGNGGTGGSTSAAVLVNRSPRPLPR